MDGWWREFDESRSSVDRANSRVVFLLRVRAPPRQGFLGGEMLLVLPVKDSKQENKRIFFEHVKIVYANYLAASRHSLRAPDQFRGA